MIRSTSVNLPALALFAVLGLLLVWPLTMLLFGVFRSAPPGLSGEWTFAALGQTFNSPGVARAIVHSVALAVVTTVFGGVIAWALAFLSQRTDAPLRRCITPAMLLVFATPPLFYAIGYGLLGNRYTGWLNHLLQYVFGLSEPPINIESAGGIVLVSVLQASALFYLLLLGPVRASGGPVEEASRLSGAGFWRTLWHIQLPMLLPALSALLLLGCAIGLQTFDSVLILGGPSGLKVIVTKIYEFLSASIPADYPKVSLLSVSLVLVLGLLCWLQVRLMGRRGFVTVNGRSAPPPRLTLPRAARPLLALVLGIYLVLALLLPAGSLLFSSLQPFPGVYDHLGLSHYARVLGGHDTREALFNTLALSITCGALAILLALLIVVIGRQMGRRASAGLQAITLIPLAMPGIITALAMTWAYVSVPLLRNLYGSFWLMLLALLVVALPLAVQSVRAALEQIAHTLPEAARTSGAGAWRSTRDTLLQLSAPSLLAGWCICAVDLSGNLNVPLLLGAPGLNTVAAQVYDFNAQGRFADAAALLVVLSLAMLACAALGWLLLARRGNKEQFGEPSWVQ